MERCGHRKGPKKFLGREGLDRVGAFVQIIVCESLDKEIRVLWGIWYPGNVRQIYMEAALYTSRMSISQRE